MKLLIKIVLAFILVCIISFLLGPKVKYKKVDNKPMSLDLPLDKVDSYLAEKETAVGSVKPDNESRIIWADSLKKTPYALVYLHGFEASYGEAHPIIENFGERYGCNIVLGRISRQGLTDPDALLTETPLGMVESAKHAIAVGRLVGDRVIVMSTSTGSTLSTYLAANDPSIHAQLMTSPNFDLADANSIFLTKPWGKQILKQIVGSDYRQWKAPEAAKPYWNERYRIEGLIALRSLLDQTMTEAIWKQNAVPTFIGYFYKDEDTMDKIISIAAIDDYVEHSGTPAPELKVIPFADGYGHVISSIYMNKNWKSVQDSIFAYTENVLQLIPRTELIQ